MWRRIFFGLLWLSLTIYAVVSAFSLAAMSRSDLDLIIKLSTGKLAGVNPLVTAIFYIMGIFPWVYGAFILFDNQEKSVSPYPFFIGSMGFGAFAILPYLAWRESNNTWNGEKNRLQQILDTPLMAIITSIAMVILLAWGITQGDWSDFIVQWHHSQFIHIMTIDFCCLSLVLPTLLASDFQRRGVEERWLKAIAYIPLFGILIYWCLRPKLIPILENNERLKTR